MPGPRIREATVCKFLPTAPNPLAGKPTLRRGLGQFIVLQQIGSGRIPGTVCRTAKKFFDPS